MSGFVIPQYVCIYDFSAEEEGELTVSKGERVQLAPGDDGEYGTEDDEKGGWLLVTSLETGMTGFVPQDYCEEVRSVPKTVGAAPPLNVAVPASVEVDNSDGSNCSPAF